MKLQTVLIENKNEVNNMKNNDIKQTKEILINQLFAGSYLQEGTNIGHEVINLFKDDNDENYLFITPSGNISGHDVDKVLFVQNIKARETMEVIMLAEGLSETTEEEIRKIYYAGVNIVDIFKKNLYHGELDATAIEMMATYKAETIRFPKKEKRIIITVDDEYISDDENTVVIKAGDGKSRVVGPGMRTYLSSELYPNVYEKIKEIIDDDSLWDEQNTTRKLATDGTYSRSNRSFLEIIRKENDELIMSNLLAYYFNYNHGMFERVLFCNPVNVSPNLRCSQ